MTITYPHLGLAGRLGNQLWQIASTIGIAEMLGDDVSLPPEWPYRSVFSVPDKYFGDGTHAHGEVPGGIRAGSLMWHVPEFYRLYLQDLHLWIHIEERVRSYFAPKAPIIQDLHARFGDLLAEPDLVAVHCRRTDYVSDREQSLAIPMEYYRKAFAQVRGKIVIFSDDPAWCRREFTWASPFRVIEGNKDYEDLILMTLCSQHVTANSTFSWWGAFLSHNRTPIYPLHWFGAHSNEKFFRMTIPKGWIGVW